MTHSFFSGEGVKWQGIIGRAKNCCCRRRRCCHVANLGAWLMDGRMAWARWRWFRLHSAWQSLQVWGTFSSLPPFLPPWLLRTWSSRKKAARQQRLSASDIDLKASFSPIWEHKLNNGKYPSNLSILHMFIILYLLEFQILYILPNKNWCISVWLLLHCKIITIDTLPIFVVPFDVNIHATSILEILVTWRTIIIFIRAKVEFTHVSPHVLGKSITFSTNHAHKTTITCSNLALH